MTLEAIRKFVTWQIAVVLIVGGVLFTGLLVAAPTDVRQWLIGANGLIWTLVAYWLRSPRPPDAPPPSA